MSDSWTQEAILQARQAQQAFTTNGECIGVCLAIGSAIPIALLGWIKKDADYICTWLVVFLAIIFACDPTVLLLRYFSPPTWLTLGYKIGGFAPTTCEISKLVEGPRAWPCQALEFKTWLANVAGPNGWEYLIRPEPAWLVYILLFPWSYSD